MTENNDWSRKKVILVMTAIQILFLVLGRVLDRLW